MGTSFKILMGVFGFMAAANLLIANAQKHSKARTFGIWVNGIALVLIAIALIIDLCIN